MFTNNRDDILLQQIQVSPSPSVYCLLHVTNHQSRVTLIKTVHDEWLKIFPLHARCVLKLIDKIIAIKRTYFFIDKRRVAILYHTMQEFWGVCQKHDIV